MSFSINPSYRTALGNTKLAKELGQHLVLFTLDLHSSHCQAALVDFEGEQMMKYTFHGRWLLVTNVTVGNSQIKMRFYPLKMTIYGEFSR